ncbi:MAG: hypothetical protein QXD12_04995, partial [Candidatus Nezhaarchaeales archaeon]
MNSLTQLNKMPRPLSHCSILEATFISPKPSTICGGWSMMCPFCRREFVDERSLRKHLEECEAKEEASREMNATLKTFDVS